MLDGGIFEIDGISIAELSFGCSGIGVGVAAAAGSSVAVGSDFNLFGSGEFGREGGSC